MSSEFSTSRADADIDIGASSRTAQFHISSMSPVFLFLTVFALRVDTGPCNAKWSSPSQKFFQLTSPSWTANVNFLLSWYVNLH